MKRAALGAIVVWVWAGSAAAQPEMMGPLATTEWNAGMVSVGAMIPTVVVYPTTGGPYPVVGVFHGLGGEGADHTVLAATLASYGLVVIRPDMPCRLSGGCNHDDNAMYISALLEWAVAQSGDASSRISGKVDGGRRGLVGHSFGALNSHIAASRDATIDSVVLLDPNDDSGTPGRLATPGVLAPTAMLLAQVAGSCNSAWNEGMITPMLPAPKLQLTVSGSGHCDPADSADAICEFACGSGDPATNPLFRRYTVAWTVCNLHADAAMGAWLGGAMMGADESAGRLMGVIHEGLAELPCRGGVPPIDAGMPPARDGGGMMGADAGPMPGVDAGPMPGVDGGAGGGMDAGGMMPPGDEGGCGCFVVGTRRDGAPIAMALLGLAVAALVSRRRKT